MAFTHISEVNVTRKFDNGDVETHTFDSRHKTEAAAKKQLEKSVAHWTADATTVSVNWSRVRSL